ncbi:MAG TPA: glycosyltransferase [Casimicrobiaceae bacterium]|nr:glycosyltransferase [Casimicrobiaceae bacterium]
MNGAATRPARGGAAVDVVLRFEGNVEALRRSVERVLAGGDATPFHVVVVVAGSAAGSDEEMDASLRGIAAGAQITVLRAERDASDTQTLERALALHRDRDVVLVASGAEVHGGWLDRLASHARGDRVGAVGTFSNVGNATYPGPVAADALPDGETAASLDALFARVNAGRSVEADAVDGPCRYVTRAALRATHGAPIGIAGDDAAATRDWSARAASAGFRTLIAGDVFVAQTRSARHDTASAAPVTGALALARRIDVGRLAASPRPAIVFVSHAWGGGIRRYMDDLAGLLRDRADVLYLEPAARGTVKLHWPRNGETFAAWFRLPDEMMALAGMLRGIGVARLHFHHVHGMPQSILDLPGATGIAYDCTLHDYLVICPQYHLADEQGRYCGEPDRAGCATCLVHRRAQWPLDIEAWRTRFAEFLAGAARVIAPSHDVKARIHRYFPALPIAVWPHPEPDAATAPRIVRVVTLGGLSPEKGLHVVAECAKDAQARDLPLAFRVLGATAQPIAQSPDVPLTLHGSYAEARLATLLAAEHADVLFFPAQVPETYSYTLSVALATDTPIVAAAIGAFPERLAGRPRVRMLPFDAPAGVWNDALIDVAREAGGSRAGASVAAAPLHAAR